jgi:glycolate oxidase iron-sulfur subunit
VPDTNHCPDDRPTTNSRPATLPDSDAGAFDERRPPSRDRIDDCVHCGFCLPTCPTYQLWGEEMDSPRGRIHLMEQGLDGAPMDALMAGHFDACLGCMACVTACPSGVRYDELIEATRAQMERRWPRSRGERLLREMIFRIFPYRRRLRALRGPLWLYERTGLARSLRRSGLTGRLPASLAAMESLLPPLAPTVRLPAVTPASGPRRARVGMLTGCVQSAFFGPVNAATARVLAAEGCEVVVPARQGCCGALSLHAGREDEGLAFARQIVDDFAAAGVDRIVVNSAGCGSAMKDYARLLADDATYAERAAAFSAQVCDIAEFLAELGPIAVRAPVPAVAAYHDACHLRHAQGIHSQPRTLLTSIPGLELREIADPDICCGSAGVYNLLEPKAAAELGERKAAAVTSTGADLLVTANPGCLLQIGAAMARRGTPIRLAHTVEILDAAISGTPLPASEPP